jgi:hypothetical protein
MPFWLAVSHQVGGREVLTWSPSAMQGRDVSLVLMNANAAPRVSADLTATVNPRWLNPTTWGLLILSTVLFVLGSAALVWPRRHRDIVYVVEPSQLPEIAARLGVDNRTSPPIARYGPGATARSGARRPVLPASPVTGGDTGPAPGSPGSGGALPAPWFARVGGGPPYAASVASAGRQKSRLTPDLAGAGTDRP